jgi:flagellar protein FliO/FliZ
MKVFVAAILVLLVGANLCLAQATQPANAANAGGAGGEIIRRESAAAGGGSVNTGPSATRVALSLAAVLALIVILAIVLKKLAPRGSGGIPNGGGAIHVLARAAISPKQRIVLLQVGRKILVLGDCDGHALSTLCEIGDFDEAAALIGQLQTEKGSGSFTAALNSAMERFRAAEREVETRTSAAHESRPRDLDAMRQEIEGLAQRVRGMAR